MLAYGLDLLIGIDVGLTLLSAVLAVLFTFIALASDTLYYRYTKDRRTRKTRSKRRPKGPDPNQSQYHYADEESLHPLLHHSQDPNDDDQMNGYGHVNKDDSTDILQLERAGTSSFSGSQQRPALAVVQGSATNSSYPHGSNTPTNGPNTSGQTPPLLTRSLSQAILAESPTEQMIQNTDSQNTVSSEMTSEAGADTESYQDTMSQTASSGRSSSFGNSAASALGLGGIMSIKTLRRNAGRSANPFIAMYKALRAGMTLRNTVKGFIWAIAITSMHYVGIRALRVPQGHVAFNPFLVLLSGVICWVVTVVGCVLISEIETHLGQQLLFSAVATCGVAAMRKCLFPLSLLTKCSTKLNFLSPRLHRNESCDVLFFCAAIGRQRVSSRASYSYRGGGNLNLHRSKPLVGALRHCLP